MSRYAPISSEEAREQREAADELGISVDELERRQSAELEELEAERRAADAAGSWVPAPPRDPAKFKLDEHTIALGRRKVAELRKQLAEARR